MTDRYIKAIQQLGSSQLSVRIGGVYALERIMHDSPADHAAIVEVVIAFIREHATVPSEEQLLQRQKLPPALRFRPPTDVEAGLAVLRRRPDREESGPIDLAGAYLVGAELRGARLNGANLIDTNLAFAKLTGAHLPDVRLDRADLRAAWLNRAMLDGAHLTQARLPAAHLTGASLRGADLKLIDQAGSASFVDADLTGANLSNARLSEADWTRTRLDEALLYQTHLEGADLRQVMGLTHEQISHAVTDSTTQLPDWLANPPAPEAAGD
ncbi:pentapeptide repeat-containing protein [Kitasatospora sp. GP82]|uniref:pentapeptide repeat-containing protein n=1 Tax=Kitasatospora sp. GP82 TaxID=3035089 RepID=UPI00247535DB|nr:pentapeptide repeat-containing protein [Kitasatospora sp. GP82]MDH6123182.1 uncharacterized protein YjbI with pentapeptide repeats [Kitasatospora sp. GP82]